MKQEIKAVFFDVDGTLLSFQTHRVSTAVLRALHRLREEGVLVVIATGRPFADLHEIKEVPYDAVVALNGADCVLNDGTPLARMPIAREDFLKVQALADAYGFPLAIETDNGLFINRINETVVELARLVDHPVPPVVDLTAEFDKGDCCQLCIYCDAEVERQVMGQLPGLTVSRWNPLFADINVAGVDKAAGIAAVCAHFGWDVSQTMAFGDGGNDVPMLRVAGIGVAMGNASEEVKAAADYVTASVDEDGVLQALQHFLFTKSS